MKIGKDFTGIGTGVLILNNRNEILLGLRNSDPEKADSELKGEGTWTLPGGKLDFLESPIECATRETKEETDLDVKNLKLISVSDDKIPKAHFITLGFLCKEFEGEPKTMEPDEIIKWEWFEIHSVLENTFSPSKKIIKNYLSKQIYSDN